ncbi:MAG: sulfotransferase [Phycisphaerales bacterium]|jgi:hypothetical protein|nr:sulfotransferase [Phycisphaerales bacterium]
MPPLSPPLKILFVAGCSRSGSTLLGRLLDQVADVFDMGEFHHLWKYGFEPGNLCSCGREFCDCPVWNDVFPEPDAVNIKKVRKLRSQAFRPWRKPAIVRPFFNTSEHRQALDKYATLIGDLLDRIRNTTGAGILVDSSKNPLQARLLSHIEGVELHVVHLVRDSRAVAFSHSRTRKLPQASGQGIYQKRLGWWGSSSLWRNENTDAERLVPLAKSYNLLKYEDLVSAPRQTIARVIEPLGLGPDAVDFIDADGLAQLESGHCPCGNPMRMKSGEMQIRLDDEWQDALPSLTKRLVTLATAGRLKRYGYIG